MRVRDHRNLRPDDQFDVPLMAAAQNVTPVAITAGRVCRETQELGEWSMSGG